MGINPNTLLAVSLTLGNAFCNGQDIATSPKPRPHYNHHPHRVVLAYLVSHKCQTSVILHIYSQHLLTCFASNTKHNSEI